jgi:hypothetical protein
MPTARNPSGSLFRATAKTRKPFDVRGLPTTTKPMDLSLFTQARYRGHCGDLIPLAAELYSAAVFRHDAALDMRKYPPGRDLTARGTPRKNIPIRDLIVDLLRASGDTGLSNEDLSKLLFSSTADKYQTRVRQALHKLREEGRVQSWHPSVRHTLSR